MNTFNCRHASEFPFVLYNYPLMNENLYGSHDSCGPSYIQSQRSYVLLLDIKIKFLSWPEEGTKDK